MYLFAHGGESHAEESNRLWIYAVVFAAVIVICGIGMYFELRKKKPEDED